jgi:4-hydroxy-2-oxoglutarate aldolase
MTPSVLETHFKAVADASSVPVYVYNIPQVSGIAHSPSWMAKIAQHANVRGVKDSSGDVMNFTEMARLVPSGFNMMTGNAPTLLPALSVGAQGAILAAANVIPQAFGALFKAYNAGDRTTALEIQRRSNPMSYAVTRDFGVSGLKAVMRILGLKAGFPRAPLLDVDAQTSKKLEALLAEIPDFI